MAPLTSLMIANRGEIACRVARTADRLGLATVGVFTADDADALHVDSVDVAVRIGSYLDGAEIIAAAIAHGADAVHPGYGFLAENADFAAAVSAAGLVWVGPTPDQIRVLGDKIAAKQAAIAAGVPTTAITEVPSGALAGWTAPTLEYPVLVKAAAGGGGRGMRVVDSPADLDEAIAAASREAAAAFGDGTVFIEPYIARGRHVEVQVFGDMHGTVVHLGERECSIQRRNQKIVEESPSPGITPATRAALHAGAVALARSIGYIGAGTVEFMVSFERGQTPLDEVVQTITFLEVNTRLQVEHPVTEAVTGLDLVELQLRVAAGEPLGFSQNDVVVAGHAIEVRVVAEDPAAAWLPSVGTIDTFEIGGDMPGDVRVDTGFRAGSAVSSQYDSLLAKVIVHDTTRTAAARRLRRALRVGRIAGVRTNIDTLVAILGDADFLAGATPTAYLDEHPGVAAAAGPSGDDRRAHLVAAVLASEQANRAAAPVLASIPSGWRNLRTRGQRATLLLGDIAHRVEYVWSAPNTWRVDIASDTATGTETDADTGADTDTDVGTDVASVVVRANWRGDDGRVALEVDGVRHLILVERAGNRTVTSSAAGTLVWSAPARFDDHDQATVGAGPIAPLPGTVVAVGVAVGDAVAEGTVLMVVEAMKMEHRIVASATATVAEVRFGVGDRVDQGDLLVTFEVEP